MITVAFGMKCPLGHVQVQVFSGSAHPTCNVCGKQMIPNEVSQPVGMNKKCEECNSFYGMISHDSGYCPNCGEPW